MPIWGNVDLLCRAVGEQGRLEAEQILSQARAEADEVVCRASQNAENAFHKELLAARSQACAEARRIVDAAELAARKRIMAFREQVIQEVLGALKEALQAFREAPGYTAFLIFAVNEGRGRLPGKEFAVEVNGADAGHLEDEIARLTREAAVSIDVTATPACDGGARVYTRDRRLLYDNSFAARLNRGENDIRREIWKVIFGTPTATG